MLNLLNLSPMFQFFLSFLTLRLKIFLLSFKLMLFYKYLTLILYSLFMFYSLFIYNNVEFLFSYVAALLHLIN